MMNTPKLSLISLTATLLTSSLMAGAFDITYDFTASGDATSVTGDVSGSAVTGVGYSGNVTFGDHVVIRANSTPATQSDTDYLTFTLTPTTPGEVLNLTSFAFLLGGSDGNGDSTNGGVASANLRIGETGADFSTLSDVIFLPGSVSTATHTIVGPAEFTSYTADLSAAAYQGMESAEIRLYVFDAAGNANVRDRIDDISLSGASVVPEASTTALLTGISAFMFAFVLKRRR